MRQDSGFTLFELMISIAIVAILSAIGVPAYQGYIQKAAMTDMLQTMMPYKTAIELCVLEQASLTNCSQANLLITSNTATRYVKALTVTQGEIKLLGQQAVDGLSVTMLPTLNAQTGHIQWQRQCVHAANTSMIKVCEDVFRFASKES